MKYKSLDTIAYVKGGKRLPKGHSLTQRKTSHPYLRITDYNKDGLVDMKNLQYIEDETFEKISKYIIEEGNIFLSIVGTIGIVGYINSELNGASLTENAVKIIIKDDKTYDSKFLAYYLKSAKGQFEIDSRTVGSTQKKLAIKRIKNIEVPEININSQKKISNLLNSFDKKIEVNNKIIENLEAQAQGIFKSWFVDFEPFADGDFVESDLGLIPKGWEVKKVNEICKLKIGRTPPRKESKWFSQNRGIKWVSIKDMGNSGMYIFDTTEFLTEEAIENFRVPIVEEDTLLLSFKLTVGRITIASENMCTNEAIAQFSEPTLDTAYLYFYFKNFAFDKLGNTSSIGNAVNSKIIRGIKVTVPPKEITNKFLEIINPMIKNVRKLSEENNKLASIRDTLLPKLMAGEIDLSNISIED